MHLKKSLVLTFGFFQIQFDIEGSICKIPESREETIYICLYSVMTGVHKKIDGEKNTNWGAGGENLF